LPEFDSITDNADANEFLSGGGLYAKSPLCAKRFMNWAPTGSNVKIARLRMMDNDRVRALLRHEHEVLA